MSEAEDRARDIRARLHQDMHTTLVGSGYMDLMNNDNLQGVLDGALDDAMFQIEHLLVEIEALHMKDRAKSSVTEPLGWPHD